FITHNIAEAVFLSDRVFVMAARPGRLAKIFYISFPRPRSLDLMATREVFDLVNEIKAEIEYQPGAATAGVGKPALEDNNMVETADG
ncbi:MAG: hypothetical protein GY788_00850, partial [bacterium]|nr:hypothetical protein [bacterium]